MNYFSKSNFLVIAVALGLHLGLAPSCFAATANVSVGSTFDRFTPAVVTIAAGDQVVWTWAATFHSTTSGTNGVAGDDNGVPSGLWNSGTITTLPHTFTNTFPVAGNFSYYCQVHFNFGMTGAVVVISAALPPTIAITNPVSGAVFAAPANVTIQAAVTNGSGAVTNVQFLINSSALTNMTAPPYSAATNNLPAGSYTFSTIAADNNGLKATNSISINAVTPVTVSITSPARISPTNFHFSYSANVGLRYLVQRSTNLLSTNWLTLATNTAAASPVNFADTNATVDPGFYRVARLPNP